MVNDQQLQGVESGLETETSTDVITFLEWLHDPGDVFEIRIPKCPDGRGRFWNATASGFFDDTTTAEREVAEREKREPTGIYFTVNPVKEALLARSPNTITDNLEKLTADHDIVRRRWLFIDIDPKRPAGVSSTRSEMTSSQQLAERLREALRGDGWPDPIYCMSGNGCYLLYRVDLPNDDGSLDLIKRVLKGLGERFDDEYATIDQTTANASRIIKVVGTMARKGADHRPDNKPERSHRPHRRSWFFVPVAAPKPVAVELLEEAAVAAAAPKQRSLAELAASSGQPSSKQFDLDDFIRRHDIPLRPAKPWKGQGRIWVFAESPPLCDHDADGSGFIGQHPGGAITAGCHHDHCKWDWRQLREHYERQEPAARDGLTNSAASEKTQKQLSSAIDAVGELEQLLERLRRGEGDVMFPAGSAMAGFEYGPNKITVVGAPPGAGKTALAMQLIFEALEADPSLRVVIANGETLFADLLRRELTRRSGVPGDAIRFADLRPDQLVEVERAAETLLPLLSRVEVMSPPFTIEKLVQDLWDAEPGLVVVDYLQKFAAGDQDARQGVNAVVSGLRLLAFKGWGVLALSSTTRQKGKGGASTYDSGSLSMASFKESGEIEFNADSAYIMRDEGPTDTDDDKIRNITLDCVKNRHGERNRIELVFDMSAMAFRQRASEEYDSHEYDDAQVFDNPFAVDSPGAKI